MNKRHPLFILSIFIIIFIINTKVIAQQAAFYNFKIGNIVVTALSDGTIPLDAEKLFKENDTTHIHQLLKAAFINNPVEISINAFLINTGEQIILIDAGAGNLFGPLHGGRIVSSLKASGYNPEQITDVLLTHIHNDHSGGLAINNQRIFPNATIHVNKLDLDYWLDKNRMEKADSAALSSNKSSFANAIKVFAPYIAVGKVKTFQGNVSFFPGIASITAAGHTPGHTLYVLENNNEKIIFCGDLIHVSGVQFADPNVIDGFDVDKKEGIKSRVKIYRDAASKGYLIAGDHISFPGVGRLRAKDKSYEWMPILYSVEGRNK